MQNEILQELNKGVIQLDMWSFTGIFTFLHYCLQRLRDEPGRSPFWEDFWRQTAESTRDGQDQNLKEAV